MDDMVVELNKEFRNICQECLINTGTCSQDCSFYKLSELFNDFFVEYFQSKNEG